MRLLSQHFPLVQFDLTKSNYNQSKLDTRQLTNSVDKFIRSVGHVVVDDVLDFGYVETPGSDGRGHQYLVFTISEVSQSLFSLSLGPISVDAGGRHALSRQVG